MEKETVRVGADSFPPYQYLDENSGVTGSDYDLVTRYYQSKGKSVTAIIDEWNIVSDLFDRGKLDALFQVQRTPDREKKYHFVHLLRSAATEIITGNHKLQLASYEELLKSSLTIGILAGYTYGNAIDDIPEGRKITFSSSEELFAAVSKQQVDVGVFDKGVKEYLMEKTAASNIFSLEKLQFFRELYLVEHQ